METPEQRALARARDLATEVLSVTGPDGEGTDAYQAGRLRHALKTLLDATPAAERWWIATDQLAKGGAKLIGPFESRELALDVRTYVERANEPHTYAVDQENATAGEGEAK